jgi:hypothetical protein
VSTPRRGDRSGAASTGRRARAISSRAVRELRGVDVDREDPPRREHAADRREAHAGAAAGVEQRRGPRVARPRGAGRALASAASTT